MILKTYQQNTIDVLQHFFEDCRIMGAAEAYRKITSEPEVATRLGMLRSDYIEWDAVPNTPRVCVKVPTGGGKTIIATYAIKVVANTWLGKENPVVLWFCPSDTIRRQTAEALKNPQHSYRVALDAQFNGRVRIFDLDDKFNIRPADIENNTCVIVSTIQAFRQSNTDKYRVYADNENFEPHFGKIDKTEGMEYDADKKRVKYSSANLLFHHQPVVIVDEAHNVISNLSQELLGRINPSAVVELTATPQPNNNTLYNVRASELKEEQMIKLPIELREHFDWQQAVVESIAKRSELEAASKHERDYVRPILLFQAQDKNGEVNVDALKEYLTGAMNIPANEIAIATGEQKELDGINIFAEDCPIKYIITVEALKEGWDCSFAYILCSLANVQSNTAVEQLLGRVMRMPYAKNRTVSALNKAYAYVMSKTFGGEATRAIVDKMREKGFDADEAASAVERKSTELTGLFGRRETDKVDLETPLPPTNIPTTIKTENDGKTVVFTKNTTDADVLVLVSQIATHSPKTAYELQEKFTRFKQEIATPSAATLGEKFSVPRMMLSVQGEFVFAEPDIIFEESDWDIAKYATPQLSDHEFRIEPQGKGYVIELDGNRLSFSASAEQLSLPTVDVDTWTVANLVRWLDGHLRQDDIPQPKMVEWLRQIVEHLTEVRGLPLSQIMIARFALANKIKAKIDKARSDARNRTFQTTMFARDGRVMLDFDNGFEFTDNMYDGVPMYRGVYKFKKHYLGANNVPLFDGAGEGGEEYKCAMAIDEIPQVKFWLRNASKHPKSFWLPTSTDKFYPDFIAVLEDGRILVVEYKGGLTAQSDDTKEKALIGELWESQTDGKGLFMIAEKNKLGLDTSEQIRKKIGDL